MIPKQITQLKSVSFFSPFLFISLPEKLLKSVLTGERGHLSREASFTPQKMERRVRAEGSVSTSQILMITWMHLPLANTACLLWEAHSRGDRPLPALCMCRVHAVARPESSLPHPAARQPTAVQCVPRAWAEPSLPAESCSAAGGASQRRTHSWLRAPGLLSDPHPSNLRHRAEGAEAVAPG